MSKIEQWRSASTVRAALYRWFADIFALELSERAIQDLSTKNNQNTNQNTITDYNSLHAIFSELGLKEESISVQEAIVNINQLPPEDRKLELAADFAHIFLLSGRDSAPPYASYYLDDDKMLFSEPAQQMRKFLASQKLALHQDFNEPSDHLSVYLHVMSLWALSECKSDEDAINLAHKQVEFLDDALLTWLSDFAQRCQNIRVKTTLYPALTALLLQFITADRDALVGFIEP